MATMTELCADLCSGEQVKAYQAKQSLTKQVCELGGSGKETDKAAAAKELAEALAKLKPAKDNRGEATPASMESAEGGVEICRALALVAGDAEVPTLAGALKNIDLREAARWCLARMTCQGATDALVEAFQTAAGTEFRVGLLNALAKKSGSTVVETLTKATEDDEPEVRLAAAEALAESPDAANDLVIAALEFGGNPRFESRAARARIRLANTLTRAGHQEAAQAVFSAVAKAETAEPQKKAAAAALK